MCTDNRMLLHTYNFCTPFVALHATFSSLQSFQIFAFALSSPLHETSSHLS